MKINEGGNIFAISKATEAENGQFSLYPAAMPKFGESLVRLVYQPPPLTPLPQQHLSKDRQHLNMRSEADRGLTFEKCPVAYIDKNILAKAGFYYTDHSDVVCCAFCVTQIGLWQEGVDAFNPSAWSDGHYTHAARSHSFVYISTS